MAEAKGRLSALGDKIKEHAARERENAAEGTGRAGKLPAGSSGSFGKPTAASSGTGTARPVATAPVSTGSSGSFGKPTAASNTTSGVKPTAAGTASHAGTTAASAAQSATAAHAAQTGKEGFTDVPPRAYYAKAVAWAVEKGITSGTTPTTFSPDNPCHKGHAATFLWRVKGSPAPKSSKNPFRDVSDGPFYQAILWAAGEGFVPPESSNTFGPKEPCTRAQILSFLARADGKADAAPKDGIIWAGARGILTGQPGGPGDACTRADIVYYLYKLFGKSK